MASMLLCFVSRPYSMSRTVAGFGIPAALATAYQVSPCLSRAARSLAPMPSVAGRGRAGSGGKSRIACCGGFRSDVGIGFFGVCRFWGGQSVGKKQKTTSDPNGTAIAMARTALDLDPAAVTAYQVSPCLSRAARLR